MANLESVKKFIQSPRNRRTIIPETSQEGFLGPLTLLAGDWESMPGHGWNMIALPFAKGTFDYRLLLNQYDETLKFNRVDGPVANRGIDGKSQTDQFIFALEYDQAVTQLQAVDDPVSGQAGNPGLGIHAEPGLWLHMANETTNGVNIARLGSVPHGDALLCLGTSSNDGTIPDISGLPVGLANEDVNTNPYLGPYKKFHDSPFKGNVTAPSFPGFDPVHPNALLDLAKQGLDIKKTTNLTVSTKTESGGIQNIPFIIKQADATIMDFTFWIHELNQTDIKGDPVLVLQYSQNVILEFFDRTDGQKGRIHWPHVSIDTLVRSDQKASMPSLV